MTNRWRQLAVPPICERMIGFSIPQDGIVLVVSYEGMHMVKLSEPISVTTDQKYAEYDCYDPDRGVAEYGEKTWKIIGLFKGEPISSNPLGEELRLDGEELKVSIWKDGEKTWYSPFENFSGDWAAVTFSPDGKYVVLGCPCDFDFRVWQRQ